MREEKIPDDVKLLMARSDAGVALGLIEIALELNILRNRGESLPSGPVMGNHINHLLEAACEKLAPVVQEGQFYTFKNKEIK